ncbi:MAG: DNA repair protein RecN [Oscillospiraceae bacterium]|jgi:DNA repair protein RecN (Recombination protein N)|nr:DNA repair protein RecN [Oscillospiraceae bacterium]
MLQSLIIENIALIKQAGLEFSPGFVVLTGETGAGKSILIDAINAVLGERTSRELIRTGAASARVTAQFSGVGPRVAALLEELDLPGEEDGGLLLSRSLSGQGKNSCRVNGMPVTVAQLRKIGGELITIHGQHDSQALLAPEQHIRFIDALAENETLRQNYRRRYLALRQLQREQDTLQMDEAEKARKLDMLRHQIAELEEAAVVPGEREALQEHRTLFQHAEKVLAALQAAEAALGGGDSDASSGVAAGTGAAALAQEGSRALDQAGEYFPAAEVLAEKVRGAAFELEEYAAELRDLIRDFEFNPTEMEEVEQRLDALFRLSRKYGETEEEMLAFLARARADEQSITQSDERILALDGEIEAEKRETIALAKQLTRSRKQAADQLCALVAEELAFLDMPNVTFLVQCEKIPLTPDGGDAMRFLISANAGEEPKPLSKVASGGELSRIMLAIKNVLAEKDEIGTLIFDEVDTGVSGRAAQKIALKLRQVSRGRQVICVTHLAQLAAQADAHLYISKHVEGEETFTLVTPLDDDGRRQELARIMGGLEITRAQLQAAQELLDGRN